jgi:hypothetical protein
MTPTPEQRQRLADHAAFMRTVPQDKFDIGIFMRRGNNCLSPRASVHVCLTAACIIGWLPASGFPAKRDEDWFDLSERAFGIAYESDDWDWLFGSQWVHCDNTPIGAALRIEHYIAHGLPENWKAQLIGFAPLCYGEEHLR